MSRGLAHVTLVGNLTRDPELKQTPAGKSVCQFGVAVGRSYKDGSGQLVEAASFFDVVAWGVQGENCAKYLSKGRPVAIDGRLDQRSWEAQDGSKRSRVEIVANDVIFLGGGQQAQQVQQSARPSAATSPAGDFKDVDFGDEDDIPF